MSFTSNYWCRKCVINIWDRQIFEAKEKIRDSITASFKQELQKSKFSNGAQSVPKWVLLQTISIGNVLSKSETVSFSRLKKRLENPLQLLSNRSFKNLITPMVPKVFPHEFYIKLLVLETFHHYLRPSDFRSKGKD